MKRSSIIAHLQGPSQPNDPLLAQWFELASLIDDPFKGVGLIARVQRAAHRDHANRDLIDIMRLSHGSGQTVAEYRADRAWYLRDSGEIVCLPWFLIMVEDIKVWPDGHGRWPNFVGSVEVTYARRGLRAIYGVKRSGDVSLWAD